MVNAHGADNGEFQPEVLENLTNNYGEVLLPEDYEREMMDKEENINSLRGEEEYAGQVEHLVHRIMEGKQTEAGLGELDREDVASRANQVRSNKEAYDQMGDRAVEFFTAAREGPEAYLEARQSYME